MQALIPQCQCRSSREGDKCRRNFCGTNYGIPSVPVPTHTDAHTTERIYVVDKVVLTKSFPGRIAFDEVLAATARRAVNSFIRDTIFLFLSRSLVLPVCLRICLKPRSVGQSVVNSNNALCFESFLTGRIERLAKRRGRSGRRATAATCADKPMCQFIWWSKTCWGSTWGIERTEAITATNFAYYVSPEASSESEIFQSIVTLIRMSVDRILLDL